MVYNNNLSICIPTYNRREKLKETLTIMIPIFREYKICFYISDNNSDDNTEALVNEIKKSYAYIVYEKNDKNLGADRNIAKVLRMSDTKYRWLLGDDDYLETPVINQMMSALHEDYDLIILNYKSQSNCVKTTVYKDMNQLLYDCGAHMTFVSSLIFSDTMVNKADFEKYFDTHFVQIGAVFDYLANYGAKALFLSSNYVASLPSRENSFANKVFEYFTFDLYKTMSLLPAYYSSESKNMVLRSIVINHFGMLEYPLDARIFNEINISVFIKNFKIIRIAFPLKGVFFIFILSFIPIWALKNVKKILKWLKIRSRYKFLVTLLNIAKKEQR